MVGAPVPRTPQPDGQTIRRDAKEWEFPVGRARNPQQNCGLVQYVVDRSENLQDGGRICVHFCHKDGCAASAGVASCSASTGLLQRPAPVFLTVTGLQLVVQCSDDSDGLLWSLQWLQPGCLGELTHKAGEP